MMDEPETLADLDCDICGQSPAPRAMRAGGCPYVYLLDEHMRLYSLRSRVAASVLAMSDVDAACMRGVLSSLEQACESLNIAMRALAAAAPQKGALIV